MKNMELKPSRGRRIGQAIAWFQAKLNFGMRVLIGCTNAWSMKRKKGRGKPTRSFLKEPTMKHSPKFLNLVNETKKHIKETSIKAIKKQMDQGGKFNLIDVREESEW